MRRGGYVGRGGRSRGSNRGRGGRGKLRGGRFSSFAPRGRNPMRGDTDKRSEVTCSSIGYERDGMLLPLLLLLLLLLLLFIMQVVDCEGLKGYSTSD